MSLSPSTSAMHFRFILFLLFLNTNMYCIYKTSFRRLFFFLILFWQYCIPRFLLFRTGCSPALATATPLLLYNFWKRFLLDVREANLKYPSRILGCISKYSQLKKAWMKSIYNYLRDLILKTSSKLTYLP